MSTLDNPNFHSQANVPAWPIARRWGLIMGAAAVGISLVSYLTGTMDPVSTFKGPQLFWSLLSMAVSIYCIWKMQVIHRDVESGGRLALGRCVGLGAFAGAVSGLISGAYSAIFFGFIEPDFMKNTMVKTWQEQGMSEEQIEAAMGIASAFSSPVAMFIMSIVFGIIFGVITGLIVGLFTRREKG